MAINRNKVMDAGRKAYEKGQYDKAIKEYLKVVKEDPKDVRVWLKIGDIYAKKDSKGEATDTYMKVAKFYSDQGFYLKAVAVYKQILKVDPRLVEVNLKLAELYRQLGLLSDAMQHFEMVAAFFHREGKTREALATLRQLVDLDPENVATRIKLAELYSKEEMSKEAIAEFTATCEYLRKNGRQDDFVKVAERLLFHDQESIELCQELATLYLQRNDPRRALAKLQICFKANQNDPNVLALLAQAFQRLDQKGKTVSVLKELARVHTEAGKRKDAEDVHEKILEYEPNDADSLKFLNGAGRPSDAVEEVSQPPPPRLGGNKMGLTTGSMPLVQPPSDSGSFGASAVPDEPAQEDDFVAEFELDEQSGYDQAEVSSVVSQERADEIVKILTETDVYVKYGLNQKAIDHLRRVFEIDERNIEARERLQDILIKEGREAEGIRELQILAEHTVGANPQQALEYLGQILSLDGGNALAHEFAERHRLDVGSGTAPPIDNPAGHLSIADEEELEFDDLSFDLGLEPNPNPAVTAQAAAGGTASVARREDVDYDFGLDGAAGAPLTMELDICQVENAMAVADMDSDELDLAPPRDPLATGSSASPHPADDLMFDPNDAAAFDSAGPYEDAASHGIEVIGEIDSDDFEELEPDEFLLDDSDVIEGALAEDGRASLPIENAPASNSNLEDDLDEADFFMSQGLFDEAQDILEALQGRYAGNPLVVSKLEELQMARGGTGADHGLLGDGLLGDIDDSFLSDALDGPTGHESQLPQETAEQNLAHAPSVVLENPVAENDADTHFDLGLAYKEMGLHNEAISAFEKVLEVPGREVQCRIMVGLCHREQNSLSESISQFKAGLYVNNITSPEKFSLYYEIGVTYESLQDPQEALYYYEMVLKKQPEYRDVAERVALIKNAG
ncbi:MAG: tetratricopeptide repeat protein [Myxococcales bacterium]|nr:tetratricopeptide repeat protein [Myxococcales bacterium]